MADEKERFTGGCLCGAVRYEVTGAPDWIAYCHCQSCRRQTGAAVAPFVGVKRDQIAYTGEAPSSYASSPGVTRSFCPHCGTPIAYETERRPDDVDLHLGTLDEPARFAPQFHVFTAEQLPWLHIDDELPRHAKTGGDASGSG